MKIEVNKTITEISRNAGRGLAEPFLVLGFALFWAIILPIVGTVFAFGVALERAFVFLNHVQNAFKVSPRMTQRAA